MVGFMQKNKRSIIKILYLTVFIYMVVIRSYTFYEFLLASAIVTVFLTIVFFTSFLGFLGNFFYATNNTEKAMKYLKKAIKHGTSQPTAYLNYAVLLLKENKAAQALEYLEKARNMNRKITTDQNISITIASCYLLLGKTDEAAETAEELQLHYERLSPHAIEIIAFCYLKNARYEKALEMGLKSVQAGSSAVSWETLGMIYYKKEDFENAKNCFLSALHIDENLIDGNFHLGEIYNMENEGESAKLYYEKALNCPSSPFNEVNASYVKNRLDEFMKAQS